MISDRPLLRDRARAPAAGVVAACAVVVVVLGVRYAKQSRAGAFDRAVDGWFVDHANYRTALWFADLGNAPVVLIAAIAVVAFCGWLRYPRGIVLAVLAPIASTSLGEYVIKPLVQRTKDGYLAYPSGHTTGWCTVAIVVILLVIAPAREQFSPRARRWIVAAALILAVACLLGLIASAYHYATDVIGGLAVALGTVLTLALLIDAIRPASGSPTDPGTPVGTASTEGTQLPPTHLSRPSRR
jgi:undecaprenyl-diphosphatase